MPPMRVVVLAVDGSQSLDILGPVEVLAAASRIAAARGAAASYEVSVVSPGGGDVALGSGLRLSADPLPAPRIAIDTLLVAGGEGARKAGVQHEAVAWLRAAGPRARRLASVCTGAFLLASA